METIQSDNGDIAVPRGNAQSGQLAFLSGASDLVIRGQSASGELLRGHFEHPVPQVETSGGIVRVRYPRFSISALTGRAIAELWLNAEVLWTIDIHGGAGTLRADLRELQVWAIHVQGGVRALNFLLPPANGAVPLNLRGGAERIDILRPEGTGVRIRVGGGVDELTLDGREFGSMGSVPGLESPDCATALGRYELNIDGGVRSVIVGT